MTTFRELAALHAEPDAPVVIHDQETDDLLPADVTVEDGQVVIREATEDNT